MDESFTAKVHEAIKSLMDESKAAARRPERAKEIHLRARRLKIALTRVFESNERLANGRPLLPEDRQMGTGDTVLEMSDQNLQDANFVNEMLASINEQGAPSNVYIVAPRRRPSPEREIPGVAVHGGASYGTGNRQGSSSLKNRKGSPHASTERGSPRAPRDKGQGTPR